MWFTEYIEEIETDFAAIYGIKDMWNLDGPYFVRFASRLMWYQGAVHHKIRYDYADEAETGGETAQISSNTKKVSMRDAMRQYGDDLDALNYESESAMGGTLFERVTVPSEN